MIFIGFQITKFSKYGVTFSYILLIIYPNAAFEIKNSFVSPCISKVLDFPQI
tara:strand:+ start:16670 stop:16825 length:156 start_codon:yes stop_codon:yes gene_type:complete